jgi:hypothetical protein
VGDFPRKVLQLAPINKSSTHFLLSTASSYPCGMGKQGWQNTGPLQRFRRIIRQSNFNRLVSNDVFVLANQVF